jgi:hypothetical protein
MKKYAVSTSHNLTDLHGLLGVQLSFLQVDNVRISQETYLWAFTATHEVSFTISYVDYVRTSRETHQWASTVSYGERFTFTSLKYKM